MNLAFSPTASRQLSRLEKSVQERIVRKLDFYLAQRQPLQFAEKLNDATAGEWRFRIGEYRVVFDVRESTILVLSVGHRKNIYR